jgi:DNA-binding SARP family transcriptional activator
MVTDSDSRHEVLVMGPTLIEGECVTPGQRSLLAVLALHAVDGAAIDVLADGVWGWRPPASARSSLQNQITRLRRSFGSDLIVCTQGRYRLDARTDRDRFVELVTPWLSRRPSVALIAPVTAALALWRGTPFHDVPDHQDADIERARLEQLRGAAVELLAIARITDGQLDTAIAELSIAAEADPYRERIWELLLVTLHLAGRRPEALAARHRYMDRLRLGLSAEPSRSFMHLVSMIEQDAVIDLAEYINSTVAGEAAPRQSRACAHVARSSARALPCRRLRDAS